MDKKDNNDKYEGKMEGFNYILAGRFRDKDRYININDTKNILYQLTYNNDVINFKNNIYLLTDPDNLIELFELSVILDRSEITQYIYEYYYCRLYKYFTSNDMFKELSYNNLDLVDDLFIAKMFNQYLCDTQKMSILFVNCMIRCLYNMALWIYEISPIDKTIFLSCIDSIITHYYYLDYNHKDPNEILKSFMKKDNDNKQRILASYELVVNDIPNSETAKQLLKDINDGYDLINEIVLIFVKYDKPELLSILFDEYKIDISEYLESTSIHETLIRTLDEKETKIKNYDIIVKICQDKKCNKTMKYIKHNFNNDYEDYYNYNKNKQLNELIEKIKDNLSIDLSDDITLYDVELEKLLTDEINVLYIDFKLMD